MPLPTKYQVILCEGVREEKRNKLTINGVHLADDVIIQEGTPIESINLVLAFVFTFKDGHGTWKSNWKVVDEAGNELTPKMEAREFSKNKEDTHATAVIQFLGHKVKSMGKHTFIMMLDDKEYPYEYEIRYGQLKN